MQGVQCSLGFQDVLEQALGSEPGSGLPWSFLLDPSLGLALRLIVIRLILSLFPQLTTPPVNTRVLAFLSSVAGDALTRHLGVILPAVVLALKEKLGTPDEQLVWVPRLLL